MDDLEHAFESYEAELRELNSANETKRDHLCDFLSEAQCEEFYPDEF